MKNKNFRKLEKIVEDNVGIKNMEYYNHLKDLIEQGYTQTEIAKIVGKTLGSIRSYMISHPELPRAKKGKRGRKIDTEKYNQRKSLLEQDYTQTEIAKIVGVASVGNYITYHPELRALIRVSKIKNPLRYNRIKELSEQGHTREEICEKIGIGYSTLESYLIRHSELARPKRKDEGGRYNLIKNLLKEGHNQTEIAEKLCVSRQAINCRINYYPELRQIWEQRKC